MSKPQPLTAKEIQSLLDDDEALIVIDLDAKSYVWVVTKDRADWKEIQIPVEEASKTIATLRAALNPDSPKPFDRTLAYRLYRQVLGPIEEIIYQKARLSFVLSCALTSLLPQVLVMSDAEGKDLASLDWLVRKYSITILPSVASLKVLRAGKTLTVATKPMIGFGDPIFDRATQTNATQHAAALNRSLTTFYRGVTADTKALAEALGPLPETADELRAIAKTLKAKAEDIKLGEGATVTEVKREPLEEYRVVYFATHGPPRRSGSMAAHRLGCGQGLPAQAGRQPERPVWRALPRSAEGRLSGRKSPPLDPIRRALLWLGSDAQDRDITERLHRSPRRLTLP